jgi:acyl transferase domain-containing protein
VGGTNAHVIFEEAPRLAPSDPARPWQLLALSARTPAALEAMSANLADYLRAHPDLNLADVAHTLQVGRQPFAHRRIVAARDTADAVEVLESKGPEAGGDRSRRTRGPPGRVHVHRPGVPVRGHGAGPL